jgi:hypothetical protein
MTEPKIDYRLKHQADVFREKLQTMLKRYDPVSYAVFVADMIEYIFENRRQMARYPLHFMLHSIQSNLLYHHEHRHEEITLEKFQKIMRHYGQYYDPIAQKLLAEESEGVVPFFINMARQQFYLQQGYGRNHIGRSLIIFDSKFFKKSEKHFSETYGITFLEWFVLGFGFFAGLNKRRPKVLPKQYLFGLDNSIYTEHKIDRFLELFSLTKGDVKDFKSNIVNKIGGAHALFYDTYLQGVFLDKPLLKLEDDNYLAVHRELMMRKVLEGLFDICKKEIPSDFGVEFGESFERYTRKIIDLFNKKCDVYTEKQLRQFTDKKICDYVLIYEDFIFLIECKGIEYSAYISSENAMKGDNSSKKISTGFEQITSAARQVKENVFIDLLGDIRGKKIIASVITYKQLYQANSGWYFEKVLSPLFEKKDVDINLFDLKPQIVSVMELEKIFKTSEDTNKSIYDLFSEKISKGDFLTGDWISYIDEKEGIPMLDEFFNDFIDNQLLTLFGKSR